MAVMEHSDPTVVYDTAKLKLKRQVGLLGGMSYVVGTIIGSGIFITPQAVLKNTGSVGLCLTVWACGAVLSVLGALTFTELVSVVRKSGSEYAVLMRTFGPVPAFLYVWTTSIATSPGSRAVQALTFSEYLSSVLDLCGSPPLPKRLVAFAVLVFLMMSNCYSMRLTTRIQIFCTAAKLLALVVIIVGGLVWIGQALDKELSIDKSLQIQMCRHLVICGRIVNRVKNVVNYFTEETENPRSIFVPAVYIGLLTAHIPLHRSMCRNFRNGPLSSIGGVVVVGVVYILTNVSYMAVMTRQELIQSLAVAQTWGDRVLGSMSWIIPIAVMISVFGGANGGVASSSRRQFVAARDKNWWDFLSFIVIASVMVFQGDITSLITFLSFAEWVVYGVCAICCFVLRFKIKDDPKRIKVPIFIPILFLLCCLFLVVTPVVQNPQVEILYAAIFIVGGLVFYVPVVYLDLKPKILGRLEMYLQLLMEVAPSTYDPEDS